MKCQECIKGWVNNVSQDELCRNVFVAGFLSSEVDMMLNLKLFQ